MTGKCANAARLAIVDASTACRICAKAALWAFAYADLRGNEDVKEFYLGMGGGERKSFKDVKSYKRRKRWLA